MCGDEGVVLFEARPLLLWLLVQCLTAAAATHCRVCSVLCASSHVALLVVRMPCKFRTSVFG
jgi:hypothetical protein